eukprot:10744289-Alexandrium_andersonii.AAC.1
MLEPVSLRSRLPTQPNYLINMRPNSATACSALARAGPALGPWPRPNQPTVCGNSVHRNRAHH